MFTELCEHRRENFSLDDFCEDTFNQNTRSVSKHLSDALDYNLLGKQLHPLPGFERVFPTARR